MEAVVKSCCGCVRRVFYCQTDGLVLSCVAGSEEKWLSGGKISPECQVRTFRTVHSY